MLLKVCGLTRPEDVLLCHRLGVNFTGFIFAAGSPRRITPEQAAALPRGSAKRVGVFTASSDDALSVITKTVRLAALDMVQLHGAHAPAFCEALAQMIEPERIIKVLWPEKIWNHCFGGIIEGALPPQTPSAGNRIPCTPFIGCTGETMVAQIAQLRKAICSEMAIFAPHCGLFLLDAGQSGGGSGHTLRWRALQGLHAPRPWLLAGGLSPDNMESALAECAPDGLDLNSGLETTPGVKDPARLASAVRIVRGNYC